MLRPSPHMRRRKIATAAASPASIHDDAEHTRRRGNLARANREHLWLLWKHHRGGYQNYAPTQPIGRFMYPAPDQSLCGCSADI